MTLAPVRVLIVDDDASVCEALKALLLSENHTVLTTLNASDALREAGTFAPEVAIVDFNLPRGGANLVVALREKHPKLRTILHTGSDPESLGKQAEVADLVIQKGSVFVFLAIFREFLAT